MKSCCYWVDRTTPEVYVVSRMCERKMENMGGESKAQVAYGRTPYFVSRVELGTDAAAYHVGYNIGTIGYRDLGLLR